MTKFVLSLLFVLTLVSAVYAQIGFNSPAGVTPQKDFEIYSQGSFIVQQKYRLATTDPQASTAVIACAGPYRITQAGIMTDPSNFSTYSATTDYRCEQKVQIATPVGEILVGIEIVILQLDLGPLVPAQNDILSINSPSVQSRSFGPGSITQPTRIVVPDNEFTVYFQGTPDGVGGRGFRLQWRALYADNTPASGVPNIANTEQLQFNTKTGALLAGVPPNFRGNELGASSVSLGERNLATGQASAAIGRENETGSGFSGFGRGVAAIALGHSNFASGDKSAAIGDDNYTIGNSSIAMGYRNQPSGNYGVAIGNSNAAGLNAIALGFTNGAGGDYAIGIGRNNGVGSTNGVAIGSYNTVPSSTTNAVAIGHYNVTIGFASMALGTSLVVTGSNATALGLQNTASGINATAMGYLNVASGNYSTVMGHRMNTNGQSGAFMIGDTDPLGQGTTSAGSTDQFVARFRNGYYLMTSGTVTRTGVVIGAGQNAWSAISDSTRKERFVPMNHAEVLRKINAMKLSSWNYKGQREIRHYGPMAQDFYAAFGHDALGQVGCDTLINSHDFAGVTFAGVQALIRENEKLKAELATMRDRNQELNAKVDDLETDHTARLQLLERALLRNRERVTQRRKH